MPETSAWVEFGDLGSGPLVLSLLDHVRDGSEMEEAAEGEWRVEVLFRSLEIEGAMRALLSGKKKIQETFWGLGCILGIFQLERTSKQMKEAVDGEWRVEVLLRSLKVGGAMRALLSEK